MPETPDQESVHSCFAARSAIECDREGSWFVLASGWSGYVCDRHQRLVEIKLEREGLAPRFVRLTAAPGAVPA